MAAPEVHHAGDPRLAMAARWARRNSASVAGRFHPNDVADPMPTGDAVEMSDLRPYPA